MVYVDKGRWKYRGMIMCHMLADTLEELHEMADKLGLEHEWFQDKSTPHYDISQAKRIKALKLGAVEADRRKIVDLIQTWRAKRI